jgi:hypothetical protein
MAADRTIQHLGVIRQAAEVVPRLHAQLVADEPLGLDYPMFGVTRRNSLRGKGRIFD